MTHYSITDPIALANFCVHLQTCQWFALDTEFLRTDTFFAELCLIQVQSDQGQVALIDPLAFNDFKTEATPFWDCLTNPSIIKVIHSARQDIEILYQASDQMPQALFDTQTAGVYLGYGHLAGLAKMVQAELGIALDKDQTRTDWSQRPLTDKQTSYAIDDVRYLAPLYEKIIAQLSSQQLISLQDDFNAQLDEGIYSLSPETAALKLKGLQNLSPKQLAITYALAGWREDYAIKQNKPRRWTLLDEVIVHIAKRPPQDVKALYKVPQIKAESIILFGEEWIALIDDVFNAPESWPAKWPNPVKANADENKLMDIFQAYLTQVSQNIPCTVNHIAHKTDLLQILRQTTPVFKGWRYALFESPFRDFLNGNKQFSVEKQTLILR